MKRVFLIVSIAASSVTSQAATYRDYGSVSTKCKTRVDEITKSLQEDRGPASAPSDAIVRVGVQPAKDHPTGEAIEPEEIVPIL